MDSINAAFERLAQDGKHRLALWSRGEDRRLDFQELDAEIEAWRALLQVPKSRPVGLAVGNRVAFPALCMALWRNGNAVVTLEAGSTLNEKIDLCRQLGIETLLHADGGEALREDVVLEAIPVEAPAVLPEATVLVKLTSGSTGAPLAACFQEQALVRGIRQIAAGMEITADDRVLVAIPLSHSYGFDNGVLSLAVIGTPLILTPNIFPSPLVTALREGEITFFPTVPPLVKSLAESQAVWPEDLPLRTVICAGAPLRAEHAASFLRRTGLPVHQFYGCTEVGGIAYERHPLEDEARGSVGHALPDVRIELGDDDEVVVHSAAAYCGHLGVDLEARQRPVRPGDRGEWTPAGRLRLIGRTADMLNVGGRKISVVQVENALRGLAGIDDAAVLGVEDPARGDRIVAFVVSDREDIELSSLPRHLVPREVVRLDELPTTERGKLDRARLRDLTRSSS